MIERYRRTLQTEDRAELTDEQLEPIFESLTNSQRLISTLVGLEPYSM